MNVMSSMPDLDSIDMEDMSKEINQNIHEVGSHPKLNQINTDES